MSQEKKNATKQWFQSAFGEFPQPATPHSAQKRPPSTPRGRPDSRGGIGMPWAEKFSPRTVGELAVHKKKVESVYDWLVSAATKSGASFGLLKGPTGCGKSTTVKVVAKDMGVELKEWITPGNVNSYTEDEDGEKRWENYRSDSELVKNFIIKGSRFPSIFSEAAKSVMMIEDWPSSFLRDPTIWHNILLEYSQLGKSPLVMVVGDEKSYMKLIPDHLVQQLKIEVIQFNPIAPTLMRKILSDISAKAAPSNFSAREVIENICQTSCGDLRSAINTLQFACLRGLTGGAATACKGKTQSSPEKKRRRTESLKVKASATQELAPIGGRDAPDDFFHTIGQALYAKRLDDGRLKTHPEEIVDKVADRAELFTGFIQENYLDFAPDIQSALKCAQNLECASRLLANSFDHPSLLHMGLTVATRGVMSSRTDPAKSVGFRAQRRPKYLDVDSKLDSLNMDAKNAFGTSNKSGRVLLTETLPLLCVIAPHDLTPAQESVASRVSLEGNYWRRPALPTSTKNGNAEMDEPDLIIEEMDSD